MPASTTSNSRHVFIHRPLFLNVFHFTTTEAVWGVRLLQSARPGCCASAKRLTRAGRRLITRAAECRLVLYAKTMVQMGAERGGVALRGGGVTLRGGGVALRGGGVALRGDGVTLRGGNVTLRGGGTPRRRRGTPRRRRTALRGDGVTLRGDGMTLRGDGRHQERQAAADKRGGAARTADKHGGVARTADKHGGVVRNPHGEIKEYHLHVLRTS